MSTRAFAHLDATNADTHWRAAAAHPPPSVSAGYRRCILPTEPGEGVCGCVFCFWRFSFDLAGSVERSSSVECTSKSISNHLKNTTTIIEGVTTSSPHNKRRAPPAHANNARRHSQLLRGRRGPIPPAPAAPAAPAGADAKPKAEPAAAAAAEIKSPPKSAPPDVDMVDLTDRNPTEKKTTPRSAAARKRKVLVDVRSPIPLPHPTPPSTLRLDLILPKKVT
jgi:hypothetical protein